MHFKTVNKSKKKYKYFDFFFFCNLIKLTCSVIGVYWATALFFSGNICDAGKSRNSVADALNFQLNVTLYGFDSSSHKILIISWRPAL